MKRELAEKITTEYLKPLYGFALKRCATLQDAEDLTQEIVLKVFCSLLAKEDIGAVRPFVWTVAHHALSNYYRDKAKPVLGICVDELAERLASDEDVFAGIIEKETAGRLHMEIAYLSKLQRRIVIAYYYENQKLETIAGELGLPIGTVKWHLFEAKKDLKKGMETMRQPGELKFNPIRFELCGTNGSPGTHGPNSRFFRSALSQNIVYAVWKQAKTVNEMAEILGVSPVYVESEAEYLTEYGFLVKNKGKYQGNILLDEPSEELVALHDGLYRKAAEIFANDLYDELTGSDILKDERIVCGQTAAAALTGTEKTDSNFVLWSLIPWIAALSGESLMDKSVSFEEAATIRPDGGHNICYASVLPPHARRPMYFDSMRHWCGPCWNRNQEYTLWQIDSEWSEGRVNDSYIGKADRILSLFSKERTGVLTEEEYSFLAEIGMVKMSGNPDGLFKASWQLVWLKDTDIKRELIAVGDRIKERHWAELEAMKAPFVKAVLDETPKHLHKMQKYGLQYTFFSDGWFVLHCLKELVGNGRLRPPAEEQKKSLTTLMFPNA